MTTTEFTIRPIETADLDRISPRCWDSREAQLRLLAQQETLGMAAWQGDRCIAQLHCYRVALPHWDDTNFPGYGRSRPVSWPLGWPLLAAREKKTHINGPVWGHACFHVGFAGPEARDADPAYFGRGLGRALCHASVQWARDHGYAAVLAQGGPKAVPEYNVWMGCLPWTTYSAMGFISIAQEEGAQRVPWWTADGGASPETLRQLQQAVAIGSPLEVLCAHAMLLRL